MINSLSTGLYHTLLPSPAFILIFILVLTNLINRGSVLIKTQYLLILLLLFGTPLLDLDSGILVPIYYLLELGTVIFILINLQSSLNYQTLKNTKHTLFWIPMLLVATATVTNLITTKPNTTSLFIDLNKSDQNNTDLAMWTLNLVTPNYTVLILLSLITAITIALLLVFLKKKTQTKKKKYSRGAFDFFQKIKQVNYLLYKQTIRYFNAKKYDKLTFIR